MTTAFATSTGGRDDATLARAAADGDRSAFAAIYDRYADRLHDFCVGMLRDREAAADCVQDVFVIAATKLTQLREAERLRPWLYAIARSEALARIRDRRRVQPSEELPEMASGEPELATLAARCELADLINDACGGLSDRDRTVLELAYRQDLSGPELADALGVTNKNANNLVERLRDTIARSLGALLVSRQVKADPQRCPELAAILDGWDGEFTVLMRKRIARHIDGCPVCEEDRSRMVSPLALLGAAPIVIPAPAWLRDATLSRAPLPPSGVPVAGETWWPPPDFDTSDLPDGDASSDAGGRGPANTRGRARIGVGAGLVLIAVAGGAVLARPSDYLTVPVSDTLTTTSATPTVIQRPAPITAPPSAPPAAPPPPVTTTPVFTTPTVLETTPTQQTGVPRSAPQTTDEQGPSSFAPTPVNPPPRNQPEPETEDETEPEPEPKPEPGDGPTKTPPTKKPLPDVPVFEPSVVAPADECTPSNPCEGGPFF